MIREKVDLTSRDSLYSLPQIPFRIGFRWTPNLEWKRNVQTVLKKKTHIKIVVETLIARFSAVERKMVSPIGREVDRGGGTGPRQNQRAWECNELVHKRVSERRVAATETFELIGMAKHGKRKESNVTTRLQLISCFFSCTPSHHLALLSTYLFFTHRTHH